MVDAAAFPIFHRRLGEDVAAAVVLRPDAKVTAHGLRDFARERLARYKVPGLIRIVPAIPKGPAGKIKRAELVAALAITLPRARVERGGKSVAPRSELEWQLADTWTELLELSGIGIDEDVFALGADSITVTQMLSRLRARFGVDLSLRDIFDAPTVAALAARLESSEKDPAAASPSSGDPPDDIARGPDDGPRPVSILQEHALRIERELPGLPQFNLPFAYRLQGSLNVPALARSLDEVVRRHESLRTGFSWLRGRPVARIAPAGKIDSSLVVEDLAASTPAGNDQAKALLLKKAELEAEQEALTPFDMSRRRCSGRACCGSAATTTSCS